MLHGELVLLDNRYVTQVSLQLSETFGISN
jgi:hypothetical protein